MSGDELYVEVYTDDSTGPGKQMFRAVRIIRAYGSRLMQRWMKSNIFPPEHGQLVVWMWTQALTHALGMTVGSAPSHIRGQIRNSVLMILDQSIRARGMQVDREMDDDVRQFPPTMTKH